MVDGWWMVVELDEARDVSQLEARVRADGHGYTGAARSGACKKEKKRPAKRVLRRCCVQLLNDHRRYEVVVISSPVWFISLWSRYLHTDETMKLQRRRSRQEKDAGGNEREERRGWKLA